MKSQPMFFVSSPFANEATGQVLGYAAYSHKILALKLIANLEKHGNVRYVRDDLDLNAHLFLEEENSHSEYIFIYVGPPTDSWTSSKCQNFILFTWEFPDLPTSEFAGLYDSWAEKLGKYKLVLIPNSLLERHLTDLGIPHKFIPVGKFLETDAGMSLTEGLGILSSVTAIKFIPLPKLEKGRILKKAETSQYLARILTRLLNKVQRLYFEVKLNLITPPELYRFFRNSYHKYSNRFISNIKDESNEFIKIDNLAIELYGRVVVSSWLNFSDERKNSAQLLLAYYEAFKSHSNIVLVLKVIGDEGEFIKVKALITDLNSRLIHDLPPTILVSGNLEEDALNALRVCASLYVNSSSAEGICMPAIEHAANGVFTVIPRNSAFVDNFSSEYPGFYEVDTVPTYFPGENSKALTTSWSPPVFSSLVEILKKAATFDFTENARISRANMATQQSEESLTSFIRVLIEEKL